MCVCVFIVVVQTSGLSAEVTASSSADLAEIEQIVKERMVNFQCDIYTYITIYMSCEPVVRL